MKTSVLFALLLAVSVAAGCGTPSLLQLSKDGGKSGIDGGTLIDDGGSPIADGGTATDGGASCEWKKFAISGLAPVVIEHEQWGVQFQYPIVAYYRPTRGLLLHGGASLDTKKLWFLDLRSTTPSWVQITREREPVWLQGPTSYSGLYDPTRNQIVFMKPYSYQPTKYTALSLDSCPGWAEFAPSGTDPLDSFGPFSPFKLIYDALRDRVLVFDTDPWRVFGLSLRNTSAWENLNPASIPPARRDVDLNMIYDSRRGRVITFGGAFSGHEFVIYNDVFELALAVYPTWSQLIPSGVAPHERSMSVAVYASAYDQMIVFGGWGENEAYFNDVWALSLGNHPTWNQITTVGYPPPPTIGNYMGIYDPVDRQLLLLGSNAGTAIDILWSLSLGCLDAPSSNEESDGGVHSAGGLNFHCPSLDAGVMPDAGI